MVNSLILCCKYHMENTLVQTMSGSFQAVLVSPTLILHFDAKLESCSFQGIAFFFSRKENKSQNEAPAAKSDLSYCQKLCRCGNIGFDNNTGCLILNNLAPFTHRSCRFHPCKFIMHYLAACIPHYLCAFHVEIAALTDTAHNFQ